MAVGDALGLGLLVGEAVGEGEGCPDGLGEADGVTCGVAVELLDGGGVTLGGGPTLRFGRTLPMRGRSVCGPPKGAFWLGEDTTNAITAAAAASPVTPSGTAIARLRSGHSPVFWGERA